MIIGVLTFVHIVLFVFWLGTDVGVFVLGRYAMRDRYPPEQRLGFLEVALILDVFPRVAFALMASVGIHLGTRLGYFDLSSAALLGVWLVGLFWLTLVGVAVARHDRPAAMTARAIERVLQAIIAVSFIAIGAGALAGVDALAMPGWLAGKWIAFGLIAACAVGLDAAFKPAVLGFASLAEHGSTPETERSIRQGMNRTYFWVLCVYLLVLASAWLGTVKAG